MRALAQDWLAVSDGALHPNLGRLKQRWREAERTGRLPNREECLELAEQLGELPFAVRHQGDAGRVQRLGDCSGIDLDALAKGWIVDRASEAGMVPGVERVLVNVGGDVRLIGTGSARIAVEDPRSALDNAAPLAVVALPAGGLASSGAARRGFRVGGRWYGHVLDPRTGWPVEAVAGVTVVAPDAASADALATVVGVEGLTDAATALLERRGAAALVVPASGDVLASDRWPEQTGPEPRATG